MPKQTFLNLKAPKKAHLTEAFLREFATKPYDEASLTSVVKELGIAKGSIYQYFEDKRDLFLYLISECSAAKMQYVGTVRRDHYPDFWAYFRALYVHGYRFDSEQPLQSHFLHSLAGNLNSPSIKSLYQQMLHQSVQAFEHMATAEIAAGLFRDDLAPTTMGFVLYKMGVSIQEQLVYSGVISPQESIRHNTPVYQGKREALLQVVDDYIALMRPAFDKPKNV